MRENTFRLIVIDALLSLLLLRLSGDKWSKIVLMALETLLQFMVRRNKLEVRDFERLYIPLQPLDIATSIAQL